jgi:hypothetical protein
VRDLKAFIEFADRGPRALAEMNKGSMGGADSPFEEAVAMALRKRGWTIVPQVGVSKFRIYLGILHPDRPGDYLAGVECDGASYHSAATARDRDKVRAAILEGLGWTLLRIWSTDWWIDKERAADHLHAQLEAILIADRRIVTERTTAAKTVATASLQPATGLVNMPAPEKPLHTEPESDVGTGDVLLDQPALAERVYARLVGSEHIATMRSNGDGLYRATDFTAQASMIDPDHFYDPSYDAVLVSLVGHVLASEAPIAETLLVQRIARAHGFQRAGRIIRDRVMAIVERRHVVELEVGGGRFIWTDAASQAGWDRARLPAGVEDIRQIEDIALAELRAAKNGKSAVEVAREFGVRRLSTTARARIETA